MKTEVYSWRVSTELKSQLEREARRRQISLAAALDVAAQEWLKSGERDDPAHQQELQRKAFECIGAFAGGNRRRAETARQQVRDRLRWKHAR